MPRLGVLSKFYVNTGSWDVPVWTELPLISDCNVNGSWDEGEASARLSRVKSSEPTMLGLEITGKIRVKGAETLVPFLAMQAAYYNDEPVDLLVLNGSLTDVGADGYRSEFKIFTWSEDQSLGAVLYKDFSVKPCIPSDVEHYAKYARIITPGTPTYSDFGTVA